MRVIENRLVGENTFEITILQNFFYHLLDRLEPPESTWVGAPDETGIMTVGAEWDGETLEFEAWIEAESDYSDPNPEDFENGEFHLAFKWRMGAREGDWYELEDLFLGDDDEPLEVAEQACALKLFTA